MLTIFNILIDLMTLRKTLAIITVFTVKALKVKVSFIAINEFTFVMKHGS